MAALCRILPGVVRDCGLFNVNVASDPPVSIMEGRRDSTTTSTTSTAGAVPDISTNGGTSSCGFRTHQYESCGAVSTRGSTHPVRRIPCLSVVPPVAMKAPVSEAVSYTHLTLPTIYSV